MAIDIKLLRQLNSIPPNQVWEHLVSEVLSICKEQLSEDNYAKQIVERDRNVGIFDLFISSCGWELWNHFESNVQKNSDEIVNWWQQPFSSKAVLILDGLSLRELPWLIQGAKVHGFNTNVRVNSAELPGDTTSFAQALGFTGRNQLANNSAKRDSVFVSSSTESVDLPWIECKNLISSAQNYLFWHHWPDCKLHAVAVKGSGPEKLVDELANQLMSEDFWEFIESLANGRKLVITSDHGYANMGLFADVTNEQAKFLKKTFKNQRFQSGKIDTGLYSPPLVLNLKSDHGVNSYVVGRRKWKGQGGLPTLTHGGLSLLELLCPFIELTKVD